MAGQFVYHLLVAFAENIVLDANPSKSGGAWWYGVSVKEKKTGFFPSTYVQELESGEQRNIIDTHVLNPDTAFSQG